MSSTQPTVRPRLFIDWATTKPITVWDGKKVWKKTRDEMLLLKPCRFPISLYIEGCPPYDRDMISEVPGFTVYTCSTQEVQRLRKEQSLKKSDKLDAKLLSTLPESVWHKWTPTEPEIIDLKILLSHRRNILGHVKLSKQHLKVKGYQYRDTSDLEDFESKLKKVNAELLKTCRKLGLHNLHKTIYGIGCQSALIALSKRPWTFDHGVGGWLHFNGLTHEAWDEFPRKHSLGCDVELKSVMYGSSRTLIAKTSPYRKEYLELREQLKDSVKKGGEGRGSWKISTHVKALNRIITKLVAELYKVEVVWFRGKSGSSSNEVQTPSSST